MEMDWASVLSSLFYVAATVLVASMAVWLPLLIRYLRTQAERSENELLRQMTDTAVKAIDQRYSGESGEARKARVVAVLKERFPKVSEEQLSLAIEAAVKELRLPLEAARVAHDGAPPATPATPATLPAAAVPPGAAPAV